MVTEVMREEVRAEAPVARQLYLTCTMQGISYLMPTDLIHEVEEIGAITPVPNTPPWLLGVMNLRGAIVSVIDLPYFLGLPREAGAGTEALICAADDLTVALAVDTVSAIRSLSGSDILPLPEQIEGPAARYLVGLYRASDEQSVDLLGVLDLEQLLRALELWQTEPLG